MKIYRVIPRLEKERILNLWHKAQEDQWSANVVPWEAPQRITKAGAKDKLARVLTPVLMSEQSAFHSASNLLPLMTQGSETESAYYLSTWLVDEARHAELFARLFKRIDREPLSTRKFPGAYFFQSQIISDDPAVWLAGLLAVEVLAKGVMLEFRRLDLDPALSTIADNILKDEARHLGFNRLYVEDRIATLRRQGEEPALLQAKQLRERLEKVLDYAPKLFEPLRPELDEMGFQYEPLLEQLRTESRSRMRRAIDAGERLAAGDLTPAEAIEQAAD